MNEEINQSSESEFDVRNQKLTTYRDQGIEPFAYEFKRSHSIGGALALVDGLGAGEKTDHHVQLAGRVKAKRSCLYIGDTLPLVRQGLK